MDKPIASPFSLLPQDCWSIIQKYLSSRDISSVSRTCQSLRASTEYLIYRDIVWNWTSVLPLRRLLHLLWTILRRPDLTSLVEHVSLLSGTSWACVKECDMDWDQESRLSCFASVVERSVEIVQYTQVPEQEEWIAALQDGNFYAFVAIFISQIRNIKTLRLDYSFVWMQGYPGRMMEHAVLSPNGTLPAFSQLELVDYGGNVPMPEEYFAEFNDPIPDSPPASFKHDQFSGWFYLPVLKHLEIWLRDTAKLKEQPPDLSNLHTLVLARSTIPETDVAFLLPRTRSLQNLHLGLTYSYENERVFWDSDCIAHGLESVSSTVKRLSIGLDHAPVVVGHGHPDGRESERYKRVQQSLKKFTCLQTAELPMSLFVNYIPYPDDNTDLSTIWPDTLREVSLRDDMSCTHECRWDELRMVNWAYDVLLNQRNAVPHLQQITIRLWEQYYDDLWEDDEKQLQEKCRDEGIPIDIVVDDLGRALWTRTVHS